MNAPKGPLGNIGKAKLTPRNLAFIALVALITLFLVFIYKNYNRTAVIWPFGPLNSIYVIATIFGIGAVAGALAGSIFSSRRRSVALVPDTEPQRLRAGDREHPGRP